MAASGSSLSTLEDVFEEMTKMRTICCPFSSNGLAWLRENREAKDIVERECDGVPAKMPKCCAGPKGTFNHGSKNQNLLAMKDHASRNMSGYVDPEDSDGEEELEPQHVMHKALHNWIDTTVSKEAQVNQLKRQIEGQNREKKEKERKLTDRVMDESAQKQRAFEHISVLQQQGDEQRSENDALKAKVNDQMVALERKARENAIKQEALRSIQVTEADRKAAAASAVAAAAADKKWLEIEHNHLKLKLQHEMEKHAAQLRLAQGVLREKQAEAKRRFDMVAEASREQAREHVQNMQQMQEKRDELDAQLKATTAELETTKEDLEDSQELVEQQSLFTDTWQGKFEELKELAKSGGISLAAILEIQNRKVGAAK